MNRAGGCTATRKWLQYFIIQRAASVQHDFAAAFMAGKLGQLTRYLCQNIVWRG
jgi:hypothetical protein